jgi:hypothetical protein
MATLNFLSDTQQGANNKGKETHFCVISIYHACEISDSIFPSL